MDSRYQDQYPPTKTQLLRSHSDKFPETCTPSVRYPSYLFATISDTCSSFILLCSSGSGVTRFGTL